MGIHAEQHFGPIVGVGAAVAGVNRDDGAVGVMRAAEQGLQFQLIEQLLHALQFVGNFCRERGVFLGHFNHGRQVFRAAIRLVQRFDQRVQPFQLLHCLLGFFLVVPEVGVGHLLFNGFDAGRLAGVVKESLEVGECVF